MRRWWPRCWLRRCAWPRPWSCVHWPVCFPSARAWWTSGWKARCCLPRLLPVRQTVGQFLAAYPPAQLIAGLVGVTVAHDGGLAAEARVLLAWLRRRLLACEVVTGTVNFSDELLDPESADRLAIRFIFADPAHFFRWSGDLASGQAVFEAELGSGATKLAAVVSLLKPEAALSEAMFF